MKRFLLPYRFHVIFCCNIPGTQYLTLELSIASPELQLHSMHKLLFYQVHFFQRLSAQFYRNSISRNVRFRNSGNTIHNSGVMYHVPLNCDDNDNCETNEYAPSRPGRNPVLPKDGSRKHWLQFAISIVLEIGIVVESIPHHG